MRRNQISNRSLKFIERNSPKNDKVKSYIEMLITKVFNIEDYIFIEVNNNFGLKIKNFVLLLNEEYIELQLYHNDIKLRSFLGDGCWYQGLKFIKNFLEHNIERRE